MAKSLKTCFRCGDVCSDRYKVAPRRFICEACYKKLFIDKSENIFGGKENACGDRNELRTKGN